MFKIKWWLIDWAANNNKRLACAVKWPLVEWYPPVINHHFMFLCVHQQHAHLCMAVCSLCSTAFCDVSLWRRAQRRPCRTAAGGVRCRRRPVLTEPALRSSSVERGARPAANTDLRLEDLGRGDGEGHKFSGLLHGETVCLVHRHAADCQCFGVVAASFGQTHVPFENVQHGVLFYGGSHCSSGRNVLSSIVCIFMSTYFK